MLHQFRRGARNHHRRAFRGPLHAGNHHAHAFADGERLQPRLLLARHARFRLADVEDHIRTFDPLHRGIDDLAHAPDVLVVNRVALGFPHLLKDDLLGQLRRNASQNAFGLLVDLQLAAQLDVGIDLARVVQRDLQDGILDLLRSLDNRLHRESADLAGFLVQFGAQVFLRLVILARGDNNGIFHRADDNLRINAFFPAQRVDRVVELTCHR